MNSRVRFATLLLTLLVSGCKSEPTWYAGFIESPQDMVEDDTVPFHTSWFDPDLDWARYDEVLVKPVSTQYMRYPTGWDRAALSMDQADAVRQLARYMRQSMTNAFRDSGTLRPVPRLGPRTLVVETALIELTPTKAWLNALGKALVSFSWDKGTCAMEARFRDGRSGAVVATFADRESGKHSLISLADLAWYRHAEQIIDDWAEQMVEVVQRQPGETVEDSWSFTLWPW